MLQCVYTMYAQCIYNISTLYILRCGSYATPTINNSSSAPVCLNAGFISQGAVNHCERDIAVSCTGCLVYRECYGVRFPFVAEHSQTVASAVKDWCDINLPYAENALLLRLQPKQCTKCELFATSNDLYSFGEVN